MTPQIESSTSPSPRPDFLDTLRRLETNAFWATTAIHLGFVSPNMKKIITARTKRPLMRNLGMAVS
jgi:hypothetical protein